MYIGFPKSVLGWETVVSSRAGRGRALKGLKTSCQCPESGASALLWWEGADGCPGCWDEGVQGCSVLFLISKVTVFCMVHLATNYTGSLNISSMLFANCYLILHVVYCLQDALSYVSIFHST